MSETPCTRSLYAVAELLAREEEERRDREAAGWGVVVLDTMMVEEGGGGVTAFYGPVDQREGETRPAAARRLAAAFDADPLSGAEPNDGSPPWIHIVVPMFTPPDQKRLGIIGRERSIINKLAKRLLDGGTRGHEVTKVTETHRGATFRVRTFDGKDATGHVVRVTVELEGMEQPGDRP